ncbi:MAG: NUDIX hydrolase [Actinobacteria bacterium]|nr:NUDIX hydrolase [Actinomycetota bacterium]
MSVTKLGNTGAGLRRRRPELIQSTVAYRGSLFEVRVDRLALAGGQEVAREIVDHPGAVVIAAVDEQDRIVLANQYRHALGRELLELPAGLLERGEDPMLAAMRELREEAGVEAGTWDSLGVFYSSPGFVHELLHAFLARDLSATPRELDADEDIELEWVPRKTLLLNPSAIQDGKTLATLALVEAFLSRERGR